MGVPELSHREIESMLGAYALDAVDREEADAIELHLRECPKCEAEIAGLREVAALLAHSGAPAPAGVWDRIVADLEGSPPRPIALASRPPLSVLASAAAAVALIAASVAWIVGRQATPKAEVASEPIDAAIIAAYADPRATPVRLQSRGGERYVDVVLLPDGTGFVVRDNLPALSGGRTYQLWGNVGTTTVSLGLLGADPHKLAFAARAKVVALAITEEEAGGVVASQHAPLVLGTVTA
jgi:hypothetical protein